MSAKYNLPRGTYDVLPNNSYKMEYVLNTFKEVAKLYNFKEIITPIFENADLFERSSGETSDIVKKEMYRFQDKKGRTFALRPEGTAPVVRSFVENNLGSDGAVKKMFYSGPMFRYDRPQKGRYRQFYQYGVEVIGSNNPYSDAEVIAMFYTFTQRLGLKGFEVEINSVGNAVVKERYDKILHDYFAQYRDQLCPDCQERLEKNPRRLLDCKVSSCKALGVDAPVMLDYLDEECSEHFESVKRYLEQFGVPYKVNPKIVRGLDYYTHTAFEFINNKLGAQNAIGAGGRYNGLVSQIGGKDVPGVGFAGGVERLLLSLENEALFCGEEVIPQVYLISLGDLAKEKVASVVTILRSNGISVEHEPDRVSMKSQVKAADKMHAKYAVIIGEDEVNKGVVIVKNLEERVQTEVPLTELAEYTKKM